MICPFCNGEMESGFIQSRDSISWTKKPCAVAALSFLSKSALVLSSSLDSGGSPFSGGAVIAHKCANCKKIIIDYNYS